MPAAPVPHGTVFAVHGARARARRGVPLRLEKCVAFGKATERPGKQRGVQGGAVTSAPWLRSEIPFAGPSERASELICKGQVWFIRVLRLGEGRGSVTVASAKVRGVREGSLLQSVRGLQVSRSFRKFKQKESKVRNTFGARGRHSVVLWFERFWHMCLCSGGALLVD